MQELVLKNMGSDNLSAPIIESFEVLHVEDSIDSQELVANTLKSVCNITSASSVKDALALVEQKKFDLFLMDVMLGDGDGFNLTKILKQKPSCKDAPFIFLTSKGEIDHKTAGFHLGADDYIVKPFDLAELRLRVEARLKKTKRDDPEKLIRGNLRLDIPTQKAYLIKENTNLDLTPLQFKLLFFLMKNEDQVLSREQLIDQIWGEGIQIGRSLDTHMNALRKKLGPYSAQIHTIYGQGYQFLAAKN